MRRIIITLVSIVLTSTPLFLFSWYGNKNQEVSVQKENTVEKEVSTKIDKKGQLQEKKEEEEKQQEEASNSEKSISKTENSTKESKSENNNSTNIQQESKQTVQSEVQPLQIYNEPVKETQPSVPTPWEALGMTEDQYYNKPMYSWEHVDDFNSMEDCLKHGDEYEPYKNGEELYNCRYVVSASGRILGIMFSTEKLN